MDPEEGADRPDDVSPAAASMRVERIVRDDGRVLLLFTWDAAR